MMKILLRAKWPIVIILIATLFCITVLSSDDRGIKVTVYKNSKNVIYGYEISGHSGYADKGSDIICAGVSVLTFTTAGSIQQYTNDNIDYTQKEAGYIKFILPDLKTGKGSKEAIVLLKAILFGLKCIQEQYGDKYIKIKELK